MISKRSLSFICIMLIFLSGIIVGRVTAEEIEFVSNLPNYDRFYCEPDPGKIDWHNPDAPAIIYGGHHHVLADNSPQSYIDRIYIFAYWGELYEAGEISKSDLDELDYVIFTIPFEVETREELAIAIKEYYEKYIK